VETFVFLLCHDAPEEMDKRFNYRRHFQQNPAILDASSVTHAGLLVSCINSTAGTKLSLHIDSQIPESISGIFLVEERNCLVEYRA
jgi:hypothetical protein